MYWKLFISNFWETSKKSSITECNFSNVAGTALLKSLPIVVIFLTIFQEFKTIFAEETLPFAEDS